MPDNCIPCISTGVYGFPHERATNIAVNAVKDFQGDSPSHVIFVALPRDAEIYKTAGRTGLEAANSSDFCDGKIILPLDNHEQETDRAIQATGGAGTSRLLEAMLLST